MALFLPDIFLPGSFEFLPPVVAVHNTPLCGKCAAKITAVNNLQVAPQISNELD